MSQTGMEVQKFPCESGRKSPIVSAAVVIASNFDRAVRKMLVRGRIQKNVDWKSIPYVNMIWNCALQQLPCPYALGQWYLNGLTKDMYAVGRFQQRSIISFEKLLFSKHLNDESGPLKKAVLCQVSSALSTLHVAAGYCDRDSSLLRPLSGNSSTDVVKCSYARDLRLLLESY